MFTKRYHAYDIYYFVTFNYICKTMFYFRDLKKNHLRVFPWQLMSGVAAKL